MASVWRAEKRSAYRVRDRLRRILAGHGHCFLDHLERDPEGGYRLHFLLADHDAASVLDEITDGTNGPGDPVDLGPEEFIRDRPRDLPNGAD